MDFRSRCEYSPIAIRMSNINAPNKNPSQKPRKLPPLWLFRRGTIIATEDTIENASSWCELWEWRCAGLVVAAIAAEFVLASLHPTYDSPLNRWGSAVADAAIAIGVVGEVWFGRLDGKCQTELRKRSNNKLGAAEKIAAEAHKAAAEAELQLEQLKRRFAPRWIDPQAVAEALKGVHPPRKIEIVYPRENTEAHRLASLIFGALWLAKWPAGNPVSIESILSGGSLNVPTILLAGGNSHGVSISSCDPVKDETTPSWALEMALLHAIGEISRGIDERFAPGEIRVVVGSKS